MRTDWIKTSLQNKGVMTMSIIQGMYRASMHWKGIQERIYGNPKYTIEAALESLNRALENDAADELTDAGVC